MINGARVEIVVDGFNVIGSRGGLRGDVATKRDAFVDELDRYARLKGHAVTVVFDGFPPAAATTVGGPSKVRAASAFLRVLFAEHERADDVIIRLAARLREGGIIVSSDREVQTACAAHRCTVLGARVFDQRLQNALIGEPEVDEGEDDGESGAGGRRDAAKRGNPRRLSKAARAAKRRIERL